MSRAKPLEGVRVADFSWIGVGPLATKYLADFGAEVIKIESGHKIDTLRMAGPFIGGQRGLERSGHWFPLNTSKRDITLNLVHPKAIEVAKRVIAISDVVVENYTTRVMKGWGLDYESIRKIKPDIIMLSLSMEGRTGPHKDYLGFGTVLQSAAGITHLMGWPDRTPVLPSNAYTDWVVPHVATVSLLAALDHWRRTGQGQYIDLSCLEAGVQCLETALIDYTVNGRVQERAGNNLMADEKPYAAPHGAYRCKGDDRWCTIAVFTDEEWKGFCQAIGNPPWTQGPKFSTLLGRVENIEELDRKVEEWTRLHTAEEAMHILQGMGVAAGVVQYAEDIRNDPQLQHRQQLVWLEHPEVEELIPYDVHPFRMSKSQAELRRAPLLGEDNEYVFRELLRMSGGEYENLASEGVLE